MSELDDARFKKLLDAGVHFGHLTRKWNPNMAPYIFAEKKGIHIIDLNKTSVKLDEACNAVRQIAKSGKKILFVATKKQAKAILEEKIKPTGMPYISERWSGGMLTNFSTVRRAIRKMASIDKMGADGTLDTLSKRERLQISRQRAKLERTLGSIADLTRLPSAIFIVDINKENIALAEAHKLGINTIAMVDTNSDPNKVDFAIPANDDASQSIAVILDHITAAVQEGLSDRKEAKDKQAAEKAAADKAAAKKKEEKKAEEKKAAEKKAEEKKAEGKKSEEKKSAEKKSEDKKEKKEESTKA